MSDDKNLQLGEKIDFSGGENQRIQEAVDEVYGDGAPAEGLEMSDDNNDDKLNFNMPEDSDSGADSVDIDLDLGGDLDLGDAGDLDLSDDSGDDLSGESVDDGPSSGELDLGDDLGGLSLSEDGDELGNIDLSDDQGLDLDAKEEVQASSEDSLGDDLDDDLGGDLDLGAGDLDESGLGDEPSDDFGGDLDLGSDDLSDDLGEMDELSASADSDDLDLGAGDLGNDLEDDLGQLDDSDLTDPGETTKSVGTGTFTKKMDDMLTSTDVTDELSGGLDELGLGEEDSTGTLDGFESTGLEAQDEELDATMMINSEELTEVAPTQAPVTEQSNHASAGQTMTMNTINVPAEQEATPMAASSGGAISESEHVLATLSSNELLDLKVTLSELKGDRENLLAKINSLENEKEELEKKNLNLKADADEFKIEISILKKRHLAEIEELKHNLNLSDQKREILQAKNKSYQSEIERLGQKVRVDFSKIKSRERELESQLELVSMDSDSQIKSRDTKILELKRKIDSLEFNMENMSIMERKHKKDKKTLEQKLNKVVNTLRTSLNYIEEEMDIEAIKNMKSDLDI